MKRTIKVEIPEGNECAGCMFLILGPVRGSNCVLYQVELKETEDRFHGDKSFKCEECLNEN